MTSLAWKRFRRHPGAMVGSVVLILLILAAVFADLSPYDPEISDIANRYQAPSIEHPFGTDGLGRDLLTRTLFGSRVSMSVGLMVVAITLSIGVPIGSIAGYYGGWIDNILMRIIDATLAIPSLMFLILLSAILREADLPFVRGNSVMTIAVVLGVLSWPTVARLVRAVFLTVREMEYVKAAQALGASDVRMMLQEILPNGFGPIIVESTLGIGYAIMEESGLSFLGFGIMPPTPSWGNMLNNAQSHLLQYPWLAFFPGLMIFLTIISVNYIGDGLRDALDPYKILGKVE
ncbi:MAG: ABC transporter permease [Anaerolineae bacterium]|nr:ABC transporter permease [Anaerolineae bacterium]MBT3712069.1 ABC transporter permease [Anaerolineae bacterium]MBT4310115.1 ABC transporter permease [Anaerolineae bacterium]MBT4457947.1 ABC transporter permease [Anaerolineae bacterium]MBT4841377.1 ABC transporter permease [Anaerolineae bacterium]